MQRVMMTGVLAVLAFGLVGNNGQESTLPLTGKGKYFKSGRSISFDMDESSRYTSTGKLYSENGGSFTLAAGGDDHSLFLTATIAEFKDKEGVNNMEEFTLLNSSGVAIGEGRCKTLDNKPIDGQAYRLHPQERYYLHVANLRACWVMGLKRKLDEIYLEKVFDANSGKLLFIKLYVYNLSDAGETDYSHKVHWGLLTPAGRDAKAPCATDSGGNACYGGHY